MSLGRAISKKKCFLFLQVSLPTNPVDPCLFYHLNYGGRNEVDTSQCSSDIISAAKEWYVFSGTLQRCCTLGFSSQPDVSAPCQIDQSAGQTRALWPEEETFDIPSHAPIE